MMNLKYVGYMIESNSEIRIIIGDQGGGEDLEVIGEGETMLKYTV